MPLEVGYVTNVKVKSGQMIASIPPLHLRSSPTIFNFSRTLILFTNPSNVEIFGEGRTEEVPFLFNAARITQPPTCMKPVACVRMHTRSRCGGDAVAGSAPDPVSVSAAESLTQSLSSMKVATRPTTTVTA